MCAVSITLTQGGKESPPSPEKGVRSQEVDSSPVGLGRTDCIPFSGLGGLGGRQGTVGAQSLGSCALVG